MTRQQKNHPAWPIVALYLLGLALLVIGLPTDGLLGSGLCFASAACFLAGWRLNVLRERERLAARRAHPSRRRPGGKEGAN